MHGYPEQKAVILLSGGLDSSTVIAMAKHEGYDLYAMSFDYGQRLLFELEAARKIAHAFGAKEHLVIKTDLTRIGGSALTGDISVPKDRNMEALAGDIPITVSCSWGVDMTARENHYGEHGDRNCQSNNLFASVQHFAIYLSLTTFIFENRFVNIRAVLFLCIFKYKI